MTESPIILVVDDEPLIRQALDTLLRSVGYKVRTFETALDLYEDESLPQASCLILDIRLPFTSGLDFQQKLTDRGIIVPIIFVTAHGDIPMTVRAMKAGAADFLSKPFRDQDILDSVAAAVLKHQEFLGSSKTEADLKSRYTQLSPREQQIMAMATAGLMNKQIAGELGLSEITVKIHRGKVSRKMNAKTFADLVKMAELLGLSHR